MATAFLDTVFAGLAEKRPEFAKALDTWRGELQPALEASEVERKAMIAKANRQTVKTALIVGVITVIMIAVFFRSNFALFAVILGFIIAAIISAIYWLPLMSMKSKTKQLVVGAAARSFGFRYDTLHPDVSGISNWQSVNNWLGDKAAMSGFIESHTLPTPAFEILETAKLMPGYDSRKFEDMIQGECAGAHFSLVECKLTQQQGSGKNRRTVTTFQGLLFHIEYPDRFLGRTMIARQGWWKGWFGDKTMEKVDLVAKELEDNFTIYSNDQVEARALLTPDRMERLIALERHFKGGKLRGIFEGDHLTLALEAEDQFEAGSIWQPLVDPERYINALTEIGLVCDVIDGFLTREWVRGKL